MKGIDTVLVMDSTGSMKKTDPLTLRKPAARLFISLLSDNDRAGIVSFSDSARLLIGITEIGEKSGQKRLFKAVEMVNSKGLFTNIHEGIKMGFEALKSSHNDEKILILMSDGQMDLGDRVKEEALVADLKMSLLPEIKKAGVRIYTIAFTEESDQALLEEIATKTGGFYRLAKTGQDLHLVFASVFEKVKSPDSLPIQGDGFSVDKDVKEMVLLITKKTPGTAVAIADPSAREQTSKRHGPDIQWYESKVFDMITVKQPLSGRWKVKFHAAEGNKVFIMTDLKLMSSFKEDLVTQGTVLKIDGWIEKDKEPIKVKDVLEHIKISALVKPPDGKTFAIVLHDDGTNGDTAPHDGVYGGQFSTDQAGDYSIQFIAEAETFNRAKDVLFRVLPKPAEAPKTPVAQSKEVRAKEEDHVSWLKTLISFGVINLGIALLAAGVFSAMKFMKTRGRKDNVED